MNQTTSLYLLTINYYSTRLITQLITSLDSVYPWHLVIVNNSPDDQNIEELIGTQVTILNAPENIGFGRACNLGLEWIYARDDRALVWLINPDVQVPGQTLDRLPLFFKDNPEVAILGTLIYTPEGKVWFGGGEFRPQWGTIVVKESLPPLIDGDYRPCQWVSGCSLIFNLQHFPECPAFDPAYFLYYEDFDLCQRYGKEGKLIGISDRFSVIHSPSSISDRYPFQKIYHSTYSYLLTLQKYTNIFIFSLRFLKLLINSLILLIWKPQQGLGKLSGISDYYCHRRLTMK